MAMGFVAGPGDADGAANHEGSYALVSSGEGLVYCQLSYFQGWNGAEGVIEVVEFLLGKRQFYSVHDEGHVCCYFASGTFSKEPGKGYVVIHGTQGIIIKIVVVFGYCTVETLNRF